MKTININPSILDAQGNIGDKVMECIKQVFYSKTRRLGPFKDKLEYEVRDIFPNNRIDWMFRDNYGSIPIELTIFCRINEEERIMVERVIPIGYRSDKELPVIPIYMDSMLEEIDVHLRTLNKPSNDRFLHYIDKYFNVHTAHGHVELETWTAGGVNMLFSLHTNVFETLFDQFKERIEEFDIDEEIDNHRQDERYRKDFRITQSVHDFTHFHERLNNVLTEMEKKMNSEKIPTLPDTTFADGGRKNPAFEQVSEEGETSNGSEKN